MRTKPPREVSDVITNRSVYYEILMNKSEPEDFIIIFEDFDQAYDMIISINDIYCFRTCLISMFIEIYEITIYTNKPITTFNSNKIVTSITHQS